MTQQEISRIVQNQREFFVSGATLPVAYRIDALKRLKNAILEREADIAGALREDLGKSDFEGYMCETGMVLSEINYMLHHIRSFAKRKYVRTPLAQFAARSFIQPMPYGVSLIMSPWNYPLLLTLDPLVDALAAGNTAVVKPSAYSPATSAVMKEILEDVFAPEYVAVVTGGRAENNFLLEEKFDYIFFTGSKAVGQLVLQKAAVHLTPVTLELGGKSPCIVDASANLKVAAKRIVFGKYLNCGQTCVAPDYVLCHSSVKNELLELIKQEIALQYGGCLPDGKEDSHRGNADFTGMKTEQAKAMLENPNYGKIITPKHFERIMSLIDPQKTVVGGMGDAKNCKIAPTVMDNVTWEDAVMQEEIFGPVMPILTFENADEVIAAVNGHDKPLALYLFAEDKKVISEVMGRCSFGGGCINDTIIHLATSNMGFGGVGESGMGSYHGKVGFDTFTHYKSIVDKKTWLDLPMRYQPYDETKEKMVRRFLK